MLPFDNVVLGKVANIRNAGFATRLEDHPANVRPQQALVGIVGVKISVGVPVVSTVTACPPSNRSLNGAGAAQRKEVLQGPRRIIRTVCPEAVVPRGNA